MWLPVLDAVHFTGRLRDVGCTYTMDIYFEAVYRYVYMVVVVVVYTHHHSENRSAFSVTKETAICQCHNKKSQQKVP